MLSFHRWLTHRGPGRINLPHVSIVSADAVEGQPGSAESQRCAKRAHEWREHAVQLHANRCHLATAVMQKELEETEKTKKQGMS